MTRNTRLKVVFAAATALAAVSPALAQSDPDRLLWGDTHLHTNKSVDAYFLQNETADADTAYRFAMGSPVVHPYRKNRVQLKAPLDFLAVTDHAEMMGVPYRMLTLKDKRLTQTRLGKRLVELYGQGRNIDAFGLFLLAANSTTTAGTPQAQGPKVGLWKLLQWKFAALVSVPNVRAQAAEWMAGDPTLFTELNKPEIVQLSWHSNIDAAERYNQPGKFSTLIGWEYTSTPNGANLHRIVLTPTNGATAKTFTPFSINDSPNPEDLWKWLAKTRAETGADFVAIPHNSNISKGRMFAASDFEGRPITAEYARARMEWETVAEITQIKGTSETHAALSPNDEFATFEFFGSLIEAREGHDTKPTVDRADYLRPALLTGLAEEARLGVNPFKFGVIGSTDSHSGLASAEEENFQGKFAFDSVPENKSIVVGTLNGWNMSAAGLAAVWARDNTREEIIAAFKRREVYGTTGPRIAVRFFGGYGYSNDDAAAGDLAARGYAKGVPMGGDIRRAVDGKAPSFIVRATKDPKDANLDRVQIVKGWLGPDGKTHEKVFDVAWSQGRVKGPDGRLPPVGDTVDRNTAFYANSIGAAELSAVWTDPEFSSDARAFYYVRVLQIPTPRNSLYDSVALGQKPPAGFPEVIQERAFSSPIWYSPS